MCHYSCHMLGRESAREEGGETPRRRLMQQVLGVWAAQLILLLVQLAYTAVTSRTVPAQGFAAYAISLTIVGILSVLTSAWLANAAARRLTDDLPAERALVTVALCVGFVTSTLAFTSSGWLADLLRNPDSAQLIRLLSVNLLVAPVTGVLTGYLRRQGRISVIAGGQVILTAVASGIGVVFVLVFGSAWTLTVNTLLFGYAFAALVVWASGARAVPGTSIGLLRDDLAFAIKSLGFVVLTLFNSFGPVLVLGRYATSEVLAAYNRAQVVWKFPFETVARGALTVLYPRFRTLEPDTTTRQVISSLLSASAWAGLVPLFALTPLVPAVTGVVLGGGWPLAQSMAPLLWLSGGFGLFVAMFAGALESAGFMRTLRAPAVAGVVILAVALIGSVLTGSWESTLVGVCVAPLATHLLQLVEGARLGLVNLKAVLVWYFVSLLLGTALAAASILTSGLLGFSVEGMLVGVISVAAYLVL